MPVHDDRSGYGQSLPGALTHGFGGEKRVKDSVLDAFWNTATGIFNTDDCAFADHPRANDDATLETRVISDNVADGVGRIDHEI